MNKTVSPEARWPYGENARKERITAGSEARHDATVDKRDADYAVAKEKCNAMAGDAKELCMNGAKKHYGK